ncbi:MAG: hypothetical protein Q8N44_15595 [Rubrivivax sp.]|nr:hypothetical protein [Rubrivivax sp.]
MTQLWDWFNNAVIQRLRYRLRRYRRPAGPGRELAAAALTPVEMRVDADGAGRPGGDLYRSWQQIPGGHKWWHYFQTYERVMVDLRKRPIRFLEVGVYRGGSLAMWRQYLHPDSVIVGLDIDPECARFDAPASQTHVRIGDQSDTVFLGRVFAEFGPFDVIIDDGSHVCSHMIKTFGFAFLNGLGERGIYMAEDTHANFWPEYRDQNYSFVDLCKDLVDLSHEHYLPHRGPLPYQFGRRGRVTSVQLPRIGAEIESISFFDSIIVIQRDANRRLPTSEHL